MTCCVPFCSSYVGKAKLISEPTVSFHEFPVTDIREAWIKAISREGPNKTLWQPHETAKVCSIHFRLEDYKEGTKGRRLKPNAVPSIFPGYPAYMQRSAERIRSKASNQPQRRYTEAFPRVALSPKSKKRLLCGAAAAEKKATCAEKTSKRGNETASCASPSTVERRAKVVVRQPSLTASHAGSATQQNNGHMETCADSRRPAILRLVPADRAPREQQPPVVVVEDECTASDDQLAGTIEERRAFGTQTVLTGVTLGALCDEIKLLQQRCGELQGQLNDALAENCSLKAKIRSNQESCGT
uniref:Putative thap domain protein n=1 Tax=Amblyomma triste TaxID=251400 RepID=A0A023GAW2_AMBTT